jgi:hypothetical protein
VALKPDVKYYNYLDQEDLCVYRKSQ